MSTKIRREKIKGPDPDNPVKLYVAILNHGWLRREMFHLLNVMSNTPGVDLTLEPLVRSWDNPICSNRNKIVRRFLETDCDFMMQIDDDVVPYHNPAEMVFFDLDIVGSPAKVRQRNQEINWVAYVNHPSGDGYSAIDFGRVDSDVDVLDCSCIGTGLILIKRNVLETLDAPFLNEFDKYGISKFGTDFSFSRKAKEAGFKIHSTPNRLCEHYKEVGLNEMSAFEDSDYKDASNAKYEIAWGDMAILSKDWVFIREILEDVKPKRILEFGSGLSSLLMSEYAEVISYETNAETGVAVMEKAKEFGNNLQVRKWDGKTRPEDLDDDKGFDLVFVDGPLGLQNGGPGREASVGIASEFDRVIIHDGGRFDEMNLQNRFIRPRFKLTKRNGYHISRSHYWIRRSLIKED